MAKEYKVGERYYLPVLVDKIDTDFEFPVKLWFNDGDTGDNADIKDNPNLLLAADEIADAKYEEIKKRYERALNDVVKLSGEIKTLKFENERLSKQNEELGTKADDLEADLQNAKAAIDHYHEVEHRRVGYTDRQTQAINRKDKEIEILIDRITKLEAEIAELKEALEKTRVRANEAESTLADYRYIFEYMPEWREYILHELCEQWRALEE